MSRKLRWTSGEYSKLSLNQQHLFAQKKALRLYNSNAIYSFIPKNACSTMRLSLALHNDCIDDTADFKWIHKNNLTFSADLAALITAAYTFVILRCPYSRLASVYLDKLVGEETNRTYTHRLLKSSSLPSNKLRSIVKKISVSTTAKQLSFYDFVKLLDQNDALRNDQHWRPQIEFLVYKEYDDYFCVENLSEAVKMLKQKADFDIVDARALTLHGTNRFTLVDEGDLFSASIIDIQRMMKSEECPSHASLYNDEIIERVNNLYFKDIELYKSTFGESNLLFS